MVSAVWSLRWADTVTSPYRAAPGIFRAHVFVHVDGSRNIPGFRTSLFYWRRSSEYVGLR